MRNLNGVVVICMLGCLGGCATKGSTDPRDDSIGTAIKCTFTSNCDNYNKGKERDLAAERDEARRLEAESNAASADLATSEVEVQNMKEKLTELDQSIESLRQQANEATIEASGKKNEIETLKKQLAALQMETQEAESDVLKETISLEQAEKKKTSLSDRRDELESLLQSILESQ